MHVDEFDPALLKAELDESAQLDPSLDVDELDADAWARAVALADTCRAAAELGRRVESARRSVRESQLHLSQELDGLACETDRPLAAVAMLGGLLIGAGVRSLGAEPCTSELSRCLEEVLPLVHDWLSIAEEDAYDVSLVTRADAGYLRRWERQAALFNAWSQHVRQLERQLFELAERVDGVRRAGERSGLWKDWALDRQRLIECQHELGSDRPSEGIVDRLERAESALYSRIQREAVEVIGPLLDGWAAPEASDEELRQMVFTVGEGVAAFRDISRWARDPEAICLHGVQVGFLLAPVVGGALPGLHAQVMRWFDEPDLEGAVLGVVFPPWADPPTLAGREEIRRRLLQLDP